MAYRLDVETFIGEVKKYPEIWDCNNDDNRSKIKKQQAWSEIARAFICDFDEMKDIEKLEVYQKLHGKWRNIRDSYVRHKKKKYGKGYIHAKDLTFLDTAHKQNSQSGSDLETENNDSCHSEDSKVTKITFKKVDVRNTNWLNEEDSSPTINLKRKRHSKDCAIEFVDSGFPETSACHQDEDRHFFESLLPAVRQFDIDQKLEFRSEVISLIKNIRCNARGEFKIDTSTVIFNS